MQSTNQSQKFAIVGAIVWLVAAVFVGWGAAELTAIEWTPSGERAHTDYTAVLAFVLTTGVCITGFLRIPWRYWWSKLPLFGLIIFFGYITFDLLVGYIAFGRNN